MTLFKSSISLSHTDIGGLLAGAGWDASMGRSLHLLPRNPAFPLTAANAAVVDVPSFHIRQSLAGWPTPGSQGQPK